MILANSAKPFHWCEYHIFCACICIIKFFSAFSWEATGFHIYRRFVHKLLFPTLLVDTLRQWGVTTAGAVEAARVRLRTHLDNPSQVEKCDLDKWWLALPIGANKTILPEPTQSTESLTVVTSAAKIFVEKNWNWEWNFLLLSPEFVRKGEGENISSRTWSKIVGHGQHDRCHMGWLWKTNAGEIYQQHLMWNHNRRSRHHRFRLQCQAMQHYIKEGGAMFSMRLLQYSLLFYILKASSWRQPIFFRPSTPNPPSTHFLQHFSRP